LIQLIKDQGERKKEKKCWFIEFIVFVELKDREKIAGFFQFLIFFDSHPLKPITNNQ